jgi:putative intracellular protease/amidase
MADFEFSTAVSIVSFYLGFHVDTFSMSIEPIKSLTNIHYVPEMDIDGILKIGVEHYDGLIIPGGNIDTYPISFIELIKTFYKQDKLLAAICAGPSYLGKAGVLNGHRFTASFTREEYEENVSKGIFPTQGFCSDKVVRDRNIITADGLSYVDFGIEIGDYFGLFKNPEDKENVRNEQKGQ